jgi:hypothetical protein
MTARGKPKVLYAFGLFPGAESREEGREAAERALRNLLLAECPTSQLCQIPVEIMKTIIISQIRGKCRRL